MCFLFAPLVFLIMHVLLAIFLQVGKKCITLLCRIEMGEDSGEREVEQNAALKTLTCKNKLAPAPALCWIGKKPKKVGAHVQTR